MSKHDLTKRYDLHRGLNPRKSDLTRPMEFASGMRNAQYTLNGSPEKRPGYQAHARSAGGYGTFLYDRIDPETELETPLVVTVDQNLWVLNDTLVTVTYSGASVVSQLNFFYDLDTSQYRFQLNVTAGNVLDFPCGLGFDEASTVVMSDLVSAINAVPDFTAVLSGNGSTPAAFLKIVRSWDLSTGTGSAWTGNAKSWIQVNSTTTNPFADYIAKRNESYFENTSAASVGNVIYISNGYDYVYKYDGQTFYRAGLPTPVSLTAIVNGAGPITGTNYQYQAQYHQEDAAGQIIEGNIKDSGLLASAAANTIDVTVANIQAGTGFNTNCALVKTGQAGVNTITVWNGTTNTHTMQVGDTAYFKDISSSAYVTRSVTAITTTTITIDGAPVTVGSGSVISNNLRIVISRSKSGGSAPSLFYLVDEIPNNSFVSTQVYTDVTIDSNLGAVITPPLTDRSPPPKGKYLSSFQNSLVIAGDPSHQSRLYWSDVDGAEYFPSDTNQIEAQTSLGDSIVGIGPNGNVFGILTKKCTIVLSGTLGDASIRLEEKASDIGCESHASIIQIKGAMCWWTSRGPYGMISGQIPQAIGTTQDTSGAMVGRLEPVMLQEGFPASKIWQTKRITAFNWVDSKKAVWFLPTENRPVGSDAYPNSNSTIFAYDYDQDAWLQWDNLNMAGGAVVFDKEVYFHERRKSDYTSSVQFLLYRMHNLHDAWDYQDNNQPIVWGYDMGWEANGEPSVLNRFLEVKVFAIEEVPNSNFTIQVDQEINYQADNSVATFNLEIEGGGWGISPYGTSDYGDSLRGYVRHDLNRERCRSMRLRFSNSDPQANCLFTGVEYEVAFPYRPGFKV